MQCHWGLVYKKTFYVESNKKNTLVENSQVTTEHTLKSLSSLFCSLLDAIPGSNVIFPYLLMELSHSTETLARMFLRALLIFLHSL